MTDFYTLADQLAAELDALFKRYPSLHPGGSFWFFLEATRKAGEQVAMAIGETLLPAFKEVTESIKAFIIQLQREQLYESLPAWIPDSIATFIANRCPVRFLPELRME